MAELEWLREKLVTPGLLPADRVEAWLAGWAPERPLLRYLVERGVLDAGGAGTLSAAIKGYLRVEPATLVGLFRGGDAAVPGDRSAVSGDRSNVPGDRVAVSQDRSDVPGDRADVSQDRSDVLGDRSDVPGDRSGRSAGEAGLVAGAEQPVRADRSGLGARWTGRGPDEARSPQVRAAVDAALLGSGPRGTPAAVEWSPRPGGEAMSAGRTVRADRGGVEMNVIAEGLSGVLTAAQAWAGALELRASPLPAGLGALTGELRGAPVKMTTWRGQGGPFGALTIATIHGADGALASVTLIGLPAAGTPGPVLGVDLIGFGGALSLVAVDLAPIDRPHWQARAEAPLLQLHAALGEGAVARRWPSFAAEVFSPRAVIVGARRGAEAELLAAVAEFVARLDGVYAPGPTLTAEAAEAADERARAWRRAELRNRREHDALARIFGAATAEAYLAALFGGA